MRSYSSISAGIGLRAPHMRELLNTIPRVDFLEVHSENFFGTGSAVNDLLAARLSYPVSLHGVGLSIGSTDELCGSQLANLQRLIHKVEPMFVSEHLSWGSVSGVHFNDLLPLPYTEEALLHFCNRVTEVQDRLERRILIENPSTYLRFRHSTIPEWEFLNAIGERTGAGLLLDINNVYVSARNTGFDPARYLAAIHSDIVEEIHLAGHTIRQVPEGEILIDDHASPVSPVVWDLYDKALDWWGNRPTLIEWDTDLPELGRLVLEADIATQCQERERDVA